MGDINRLFGDNENDSNNQNVSGEDALKLLVGEEAKYKTPEELAKAMLFGQQHITEIEKENATLREDKDKAASIADILAAVKAPTPEVKPETPPADPQPNVLASDDVQSLINKALANKDASTLALSNQTAVKDALSKALGDKAGQAYTDMGSSLNVDLDELSAKSPQAVINLVLQQRPNVEQQEAPASTMQYPNGNSTTNTAATYKEIQVQFKAGKLTRVQKHDLENSQLTKLGSDKFWS